MPHLQDGAGDRILALWSRHGLQIFKLFDDDILMPCRPVSQIQTVAGRLPTCRACPDRGVHAAGGGAITATQGTPVGVMAGIDSREY
eukprot:CAMPEP_0174333882 /NCGR_PEP_ID=MMETSP0810-20121108/19493_1 /TAXON_ID=73025 ORGANISM="Eutreptiella gymnastica-like, Strain CCMP1594" /NCGR_SAMPLE_ID=MMETSP0810 /ASSEMBLY_ACC=CAM_ASM_000659 /LENGTH=86 /DNA_ID=CAMNT_0015451237 /DNA_START=301 /DNA_END=561 /DNA_ORIENTATION=+